MWRAENMDQMLKSGDKKKGGDKSKYSKRSSTKF